MTFSFFIWPRVVGLVTVSEAAASSQIEEMIQELSQQERAKSPSTGMSQEKAIIEVGETSTLQDSPKDLPSLDPQTGKEMLVF